jgi:hypothetical protein
MLTDDATLVALARTLRLIILIQDLSSTNKTLRASWEERQMEILKLVRDLAAGQLGTFQHLIEFTLLISIRWCGILQPSVYLSRACSVYCSGFTYFLDQ